MGAPLIRFYRPAEQLQPYISTYYLADIPAGEPVHDLLHPEWANIRFIFSGHWTARLGDMEVNSSTTPATIYGPTSRTISITGIPPTRTAGVGLLPLGWSHLIGLPADKFSDRMASLEEVFPDADSLWQSARDAVDDTALRSVFDKFFLRLATVQRRPTPLLQLAHALLLDPAITTAEQFAAALGRSSRQVARLSLDMFGFPPKLLLRRQRFLRTLAVLRANLDKPWMTLIDGAYYDHSQFVRDFHRFMDMSPTQYFALPRLLLDPAARLRQSQIGESLQGLHPALPESKP
jgi:AraC-like DNA-binding protein